MGSERALCLTPRQTEVVRLVANGRSAAQIGRELRLSVRTVEDHLARARLRIGAATTAELVACVVTADIVSLGAMPAGPGDRRRRGGTAGARHVIMSTKSSISEHDQQGSCAPAEDEWRGKRGRPTVMTPDRIDAAAEMLSSHPVAQIARKLGVSRGTVYAHMRAIQAVRRRTERRLRARKDVGEVTVLRSPADRGPRHAGQDVAVLRRPWRVSGVPSSRNSRYLLTFQDYWLVLPG